MCARAKHVQLSNGWQGVQCNKTKLEVWETLSGSIDHIDKSERDKFSRPSCPLFRGKRYGLRVFFAPVFGLCLSGALYAARHSSRVRIHVHMENLNVQDAIATGQGFIQNVVVRNVILDKVTEPARLFQTNGSF
ncbi:hypothetical protein BD769DRAFT_1389342 [Suillus cothurnatus]|nr:hypothetical protein BD769DRAFT_1389342 [Suillus cothurnatus]